MENIIRDMTVEAEKHHDYDLAKFAYKLMNKLADTFNCPSNWKEIGENMKEEFAGDDWIMENCKLWDF